MSRIIAICPKEYPGVCSVFRNGQALKLWNFYNLEHKFPIESDLYIFGGWHPGYRNLIERLTGKKSILITSSPAQLEMGVIDLEYLRIIMDFKNRGLIDTVFCGSSFLADWLEAVYFPYPIFLPEEPMWSWASKSYSVGLFLPSHYRKNIFNQILALEILKLRKPALEIITNVTFPYIPSDFKFVGWQPRSPYKQLISTLKVFLHATWTETLGYAAIDAIRQGTIPLLSVQNAQVLGSSQFIENIDNPLEIARKLEEILNLDSERYWVIIKNDFGRIKKLAVENLQKLQEVLSLYS